MTTGDDGTWLSELEADLWRNHPWIMRRSRLRMWRREFVGAHLPWLCRHTSSTGPAGGRNGMCLYCGRKVIWRG